MLSQYVGDPTRKPASKFIVCTLTLLAWSVVATPPAAAQRSFLHIGVGHETREGGTVTTTLVFEIGEQTVTAAFVEDVLVRYTISSK